MKKILKGVLLTANDVCWWGADFQIQIKFLDRKMWEKSGKKIFDKYV